MDQVGGNPGDRHRRRLGVAGNLKRQDRGVDDPRPGHTAHAQLGIYDIIALRAALGEVALAEPTAGGDRLPRAVGTR
jgi:hypothetical protein